jgi:hypothetical protein
MPASNNSNSSSNQMPKAVIARSTCDEAIHSFSSLHESWIASLRSQ